MKGKKLIRKFFERDTVQVAKELLGKFLVKDGFIGQIIETEAYSGDIDPACHTFKGKTKRTEIMFDRGGKSYVYFIYGMYFCFNIVTEKKGKGCAVLIRGIKPIKGPVINGPGKLCYAFNITKKDNGTDLTVSKKFYVLDTGFVPQKINVSKRIGINKGKELDWRFFIDID